MKAIGTPYKHEKDANVFIYPVTVPFPHFPNKTIKMAIRKSESGKLIIDGALTIWW